ncbi:MAG: hypothetical protein ACRCSG_05820 [Cellulosilyticaceae bacterium]
MKTLIALGLISRNLYNIRFQSIAFERFFYLKCIIYLFVSTLTADILDFTFPTGAIIMALIMFFDYKNTHIKLKMIGTGLIIVLISFVNFQQITSPLQSFYLYKSIQDVNKIDLYSYNSSNQNFLLSISDTETIDSWISQLQQSTPSIQWNQKSIGSNLGYRIILQHDDTTTSIDLRLDATGVPNTFIGPYYISYYNDSILDEIYKIYPNTPSSLTINTSKSASINIYNTSTLNNLWRTILWHNPVSGVSINPKEFTIPSYLFFEKHLGCRLSFTTNFQYALINNSHTIELPPYLQALLKEQYVLSQLDLVNQFTLFDTAHVSNVNNTSLNLSIRLDPNEIYYGLYVDDYKTNEATLLHYVTSSSASFYSLKHPYILLLDEKDPDSNQLMLINQNIPEKHRYIVKDENIISKSIALCPQNSTFTYIIDYGDYSSLFLVNDYYRSPHVIASGNISDSLFLSDDYIAFIQDIDGTNLLSIYSLSLHQVIKYIQIPGEIFFTSSHDNKINFAVQSIEGLNLKEAIFCLDDNLNIYKLPNNFRQE